MKQLLIETLNTFGLPVFLQGTFNPEEAYPESFITFWTDYTEDGSHLDDNVVSVDWHFSVIFYSSDAALVNTKPFEIMAALKSAGFIPQGKGNDVPSDEPSHTGWAIEYTVNEIL